MFGTKRQAHQPPPWSKVGFDLVAAKARAGYHDGPINVSIRRCDTGETFAPPNHISGLLWESRAYYEAGRGVLFSVVSDGSA